MTERLKTEILIVGGGPAGLSAASVIRNGRVTILDDNPMLGGQIWRAEIARISPEARRLVESLDPERVSVIGSASVFDRIGAKELAAETPSGLLEIGYERLIIATGARERFLPFPGWTLPGVYGAGGLQALVKGGLDVSGKRVVVAGSGPLLPAVAAFVADRGAHVRAIVEQAPASRLFRFAFGLIGDPSKVVQAAGLGWKLGRTRIRTGSWIVSARGNGRVESVRLNDSDRPIDCDIVGCGFHLEPNTELARLLGCRTEGGNVWVDRFQMTSESGIFCAGEPTGIGGVELGSVEGRIAGFAADDDEASAARLFARRERYRRFADRLERCFELRDELRSVADDETIVCRCEDVTAGSLRHFGSFREAKIGSRCGMGPCQGRVCGPAARFVYGWEEDRIRSPLIPVSVETLSNEIEFQNLENNK